MLSYLVIGLFTGAAYGLLAVGFVLVYRGTRVFNLAHGEIGATGLFVAWTLLAWLPVGLAALVGILVAALVGLSTERLLLRRLTDRTPLAALAVTLGAALTLAYLHMLVWGATVKTFPSPVGNATFDVGGLTITTPRLVALVAAVTVALGLAAFLRRTRAGLTVWATTSDPALARLSSVDVPRVRSLVWAAGGAVAGLAAILLAVIYSFHPLFMTLVLVRALAAALLGGLNSLTGALLGGLAIGVVESMVIATTGRSSAVDVAVFAVILGVLLLRPQGLLGGARA